MHDKVCLITGAAGTIGRAAARRLVAEGARVVLVDRDDAALRQAAAEFRSEAVAAVTADVARAADAERYAEAAVASFGAVDFFFANAGIEGPNAPIPQYPDDAFDQIMRINVTGVFLGLKHVLPRMRDGGSIVITSSTAGLRGSPSFVGYIASKHAVVGLMRAAAVEAAPRRIRVNTIHPAMVEGEMIRRLEEAHPTLGPDDARRFFKGRIPLGRYIAPEEIAEAVLYLASDESRMVTGTTFVVDGGSLLG